MSSTYGFGPAPNYMPPVPATTGQPRLVYFITRSNGIPIPLIPADELPYSVKLQNVPRVLSPDQTYGLYYVGAAPFSGATFKLDNIPVISPVAVGAEMQRSSSDNSSSRVQNGNIGKVFLAPDALVRQAAVNAGTSIQGQYPKRPYSAAETATTWRRTEPLLTSSSYGKTSTSPPAEGGDSAQSIIDAILRTDSGMETADRLGYRRPNDSPPPSGVIPNQEKKEYCTYWILHGDCAYVQQGCRYKHEMPDRSKLAEIGINHVPRWWLERNASIRLGGSGVTPERAATVGPWRKPEEGLRKGSDSSVSTSGEDGGDERSSDASLEVEKKVMLKMEDGKAVAPGAVFENDSGSKSSIVPPTRPPTPAEKGRKPSVASDLIDFAPLQPTPAPAPACKAIPKQSPPLPEKTILKREVTARAEIITPTRTTKVFVPAGESPEEHIAEAKRRDQRNARAARNKGSRTPSPELASDKAVTDSEKKAGGIQSSRWAPGELSHKRSKSGRRPRRPVSTPSPIAKPKASGDAEKK